MIFEAEFPSIHPLDTFVNTAHLLIQPAANTWQTIGERDLGVTRVDGARNGESNYKLGIDTLQTSA